MNNNSDMKHYIDDYLWMKENNIKNDAMKPMDYLWHKEGFESCNEEVLTFWICKFIIDVCNNLSKRIKTFEFTYSFPEDIYAETQEDLFYCVLLSLHNHFLCHQNVESITMAYQGIK